MRITCQLCPHACQIAEGDTGMCGQGWRSREELFLDNMEQ